MLSRLWSTLDGKKTHIIAVVFALFNVLLHYHVVTLSADSVSFVNDLLAAGGLVALRLAVS